MSATKTLPVESTATPVGTQRPLGSLAQTLPVKLPPWPNTSLAASPWTTPLLKGALNSSTRLLQASATYRFPLASTATPATFLLGAVQVGPPRQRPVGVVVQAYENGSGWPITIAAEAPLVS